MVGAPRDGNVESCKATRPRARVHAYIPGYSRQESAGTGVTLAIGAHSLAKLCCDPAQKNAAA